MSDANTTSGAHHQAIIIGGGQSGLATAYHLLNAGVDTLVLDNGVVPGGAWNHYWPTMRLLSPAEATSLPGMPMPPIDGELRPAHVVKYLTNYEGRFDIPVDRPVRVATVSHDGERFHLATDRGAYTADHLVAATGTWSTPYVPSYPGTIMGQFWHSANYPGPDTFRGTRVAVMGAGNSGAQIAAELSEVAEVTWLTRHEPRYLPREIDGPEIFRRDADQQQQLRELGDIVQTPLVREALDAGRMNPQPVPDSLDELDVNHFIWATGFLPALGPVEGLLDAGGRPVVDGLHLVGYGEWTGPGSHHVGGVGRSARQVVGKITRAVGR